MVLLRVPSPVTCGWQQRCSVEAADVETDHAERRPVAEAGDRDVIGAEVVVQGRGGADAEAVAGVPGAVLGQVGLESSDEVAGADGPAAGLPDVGGVWPLLEELGQEFG